jgi:hypothetical protein
VFPQSGGERYHVAVFDRLDQKLQPAQIGGWHALLLSGAARPATDLLIRKEGSLHISRRQAASSI